MDSFSNIVTERFYVFLSNKISSKEITQEELSSKMGLSEKNARVFMHRLRNGQSVKVDEILIAKEHFGLDPVSLFNEDSFEKINFASQKIGQKLKTLFGENDVNEIKLAKSLKITKEYLNDVLDGKVELSAYKLIAIAAYLDVSLAEFDSSIRTRTIKEKSMIEVVKELEERIKNLEDKGNTGGLQEALG